MSTFRHLNLFTRCFVVALFLRGLVVFTLVQLFGITVVYLSKTLATLLVIGLAECCVSLPLLFDSVVITSQDIQVCQ